MSNDKLEATYGRELKPVLSKLRNPERTRLIAGLVVASILLAIDLVMVVWGVWLR
jgi:hypothetical protein